MPAVIINRAIKPRKFFLIICRFVILPCQKYRFSFELIIAQPENFCLFFAENTDFFSPELVKRGQTLYSLIALS